MHHHKSTLRGDRFQSDRHGYPLPRCRRFCKEMSGLFSIQRAHQSTNLYTKPNGPFDRLLFVDSMFCFEPMPMMLETTALIFSAVYFGSTVYITLVEQPARLACAPEVALAQWAQSVKSTPRYAASALIAAGAALIHSKVALVSPWTWGSILLLTVLQFTVVALLQIQRQLAEPNSVLNLSRQLQN